MLSLYRRESQAQRRRGRRPERSEGRPDPHADRAPGDDQGRDQAGRRLPGRVRASGSAERVWDVILYGLHRSEMGDERHGSAGFCGSVSVCRVGIEPEAGASGRPDRLGSRGASGVGRARGTARASALCALVDVEGALSSGALRPVGPRPRGGASGSSVVPALLRLCARRGHAGRDHDLPLPRRRGGGSGSGLRGDRPPARRRRSDPAQGHADGRHAGGLGLAPAVLQGRRGGGPPGSPAPTGPGRRVAPSSATRRISASTRARG